MGATLDRDTILSSFAQEALTVDATAGGVNLTVATFNPSVTDGVEQVTRALVATIKNVGAEIRITVDGTTVTATVGFVIADGASFEVWGIDDITALRAIRTGSVSSIITAIYARRPASVT